MVRLLVLATLGLLGVGLLAHPLLLSLPVGQPLHPTFEAADASSCSSTIAYADLPSRARHSFDTTSHDDMPYFNDTLYMGQHTAAVEAFREHDCIRRNGKHYDVYLIHRDGVFPAPETLVSPLLSVVGVLSLIGAVAIYARDRRAI